MKAQEPAISAKCTNKISRGSTSLEAWAAIILPSYTRRIIIGARKRREKGSVDAQQRGHLAITLPTCCDQYIFGTWELMVDFHLFHFSRNESRLLAPPIKPRYQRRRRFLNAHCPFFFLEFQTE